MLKVNKKLIAAMNDINRTVNQMPYKTDLEMYGKLEHWNPADAEAGDCDDYACIKRRKLRDLYPANIEAFRLATCWVEGDDGEKGKGGYHAVLTVHTNKGVYVLDNRYPQVTPWRKLPYKFHMMEQPGKTAWVLIEN